MVLFPIKSIDQTHFEGKHPHVRGHRIRVSTLAYHARDNNWSVEDLMFNFDLSEPKVLAALLYYSEHKATIDQLERDETETYQKYF